MAKAKANIEPEPVPKVGDKVNYVIGEHTHEVLPAEVTKVHDDHEGRLVNLSVGGKIVENVAWDDVGKDLPLHGNSWHWPVNKK